MNGAFRARLRALLCAGDAVLIVLCVAAAALAGWMLAGREQGAYAEISTPAGSFSLSLSAPLTRTVEGRDGYTLTLEIAHGRIRVQSADCPDHVCVNTGWLERDGQTAACLPAGVVVTVRGRDGTGENGGYDAVSR